MLSSIKGITVNYDAVNEEKTFSSGDMLSGRVLLVLSKETKIEGLRVKMKGKAEVQWSERHLGEKRTRHYSSKEKYFKLEQLVTGQEKVLCIVKMNIFAILFSEVVLAAGSHVYPFTFQIPQGNMPSSFKGDHGKVKYKLEAKLSRSWRLPSNAASAFTFVSRPEMGVLNQTMNSALGSLRHLTIQECSTKTTYSGVLCLDALTGERLKVTVDIQNSSSRDLAPKIAVDQVQSFFTDRRGKVCKHQMLNHVGEPVPANTKKMLTQVLRLPPNLIIRVEYFLKVYLEVPFASDPEVKLPLVILPADFAPGAFPSKPAPAAAPPSTAPGAFPSKSAPAAAPPSTAPGAFPSKPAPAAAPPSTAPGAFPYQPAPWVASPPSAPGVFSYETAPLHAPPPIAPGAFPYETAPGAAAPSIAPGAFLYQSPPDEPYTFLSYSSPDAPPAYDVLSQPSPQSPPSPPPSYSDAIKCSPPTAPGCSLPQMPQGTYPLQGALDPPEDALKTKEIF
uniref:Arrestin C-terminal-like domain-containing protein n=1 Tax=Paramormyrops kingsleyae TaxID=1676925 RepID=A0A3B3SGT5_9TELE